MDHTKINKQLFAARFGSDQHRDKLLGEKDVYPGVLDHIAVHGTDFHRAKVLHKTDNWATAYTAKQHYKSADITKMSNAELRDTLNKHHGEGNW